VDGEHHGLAIHRLHDPGVQEDRPRARAGQQIQGIGPAERAREAGPRYLHAGPAVLGRHAILHTVHDASKPERALSV